MSEKLRPLGTPSPVDVRTGPDGRPVAVLRDSGDRTVVQIRERWRIDDEWWREPVSRLYFDVVLENGEALTLYRDRIDGGWYV
ncbi:MAG TPA: hypothetical protein VLL48_09585 [Longimicrobiales bacterium]|nr:hypothetical protein [Longimicrobiales bacterium]